jgi:hypothetical protein
MLKLSEDFDNLVLQINAKIKEAGDALEAASNLSQKAGLQGQLIYTQFTNEYVEFERVESDDDPDESDELYDVFAKIDVSPIESALDGSGWQTSSSYC